MVKEKPNLIVILCDDLGYGDLGCYGSELHRTPNIDQMASEGVLMTDFYMSASVCSPSRASLMTGCYAQRIGLSKGEKIPVLLPGDRIGISSEETTIAELLKQQDYQTGIIGKWHLGDQPAFWPTRHGFDYFFGLPYSNDMHPEHPNNVKYNFPPLPLMRNEEIIEIDPDQDTLIERYTEEAVHFIEKNTENPFFLYFAHKDVHAPHHSPERFYQHSLNGHYGATVEAIDWSTGVILQTLKRVGIDHNTWVIFTSDNGGRWGSNAPLRGVKGSSWEGGFRVPCLMRWPGKIPEKRKCHALTTSMDILPTIARLVGAEPPPDIDGKDIWSTVIGEKNAKSPYESFVYYKGDRLEAIRCGDWKLHLLRKELYNLREDIGESTNVIDQFPDIVNKLQEIAQHWRTELGDENLPGIKQREPGRVEQPVFLVNHNPDWKSKRHFNYPQS